MAPARLALILLLYGALGSVRGMALPTLFVPPALPARFGAVAEFAIDGGLLAESATSPG